MFRLDFTTGLHSETTDAHAGLLFNSRALKTRPRTPPVHAELEAYLGARWYLLAAHSSDAISTTAQPQASC